MSGIIIVFIRKENELSFSSFSPSLKSLHSVFNLISKHFKDDSWVSCFPALLFWTTNKALAKIPEGRETHFFFSLRYSSFFISLKIFAHFLFHLSFHFCAKPFLIELPSQHLSSELQI